jgi:hypothetical protein
MQPLSIALQNFNNRVKQMNQTNSKQLVLSAEEARNLHSDLFSLITSLAEMQVKPEISEPVGQISLDGGGFR